MEFKLNPFSKRVVAILRRREVQEGTVPPTVWDLTILVGTVVFSFFLVSVIYDSGLISQIADTEVQLRTLREQDATVQEQLAEQLTARNLFELEQNVPHPNLVDRDLQAIGNHVDVSWGDPAQAPGRYVSYEVELRRLDGGQACKDQIGPICIFLASDSRNSTSRIPAQGNLEQGQYVWRVAAVPTGTALSADPAENRNSLLSDWSAFASFTLYGSQTERIWSTQTIRVGLDLNQGSKFAQRSSDGTIKGIEISMIYTLVEGCLRFKRSLPHELYYSATNCKAFLSDHPSPIQITSRNDRCVPNHDYPCVLFVPIDHWGSYPAAVKRKEVDLFLGTATAAGERERSGMRFTAGYFPIHSKLYGHTQDVASSTDRLSQWLSHDRVIGAISGSTNAYILGKLIDKLFPPSQKRAPTVHMVQFDSFPSMEAAMDKGEIDGLIIDDAFVDRTDWSTIEGPIATDVLSSYLKDYIHGALEEYAIAVAVGDKDQVLYTQLQAALKDGLITHDKLALFIDNRTSE